MTNKEILAKLDIEKAIAHVTSQSRLYTSVLIDLATVKSQGGDKGVLQIAWTKEADVIRDFEHEVNPEYEKADPDPVESAIAELRSMVDFLDQNTCNEWPERKIAESYGPSLLAEVRKLLEVHDARTT